VEWFTLLLGSFDLTFERTRDGNRLRLVPLPQPLTYDHVYRVSGDIVATGKAIKQMYPELTLRREETTRIGVTANAEQHYAIAKLLQSQRKPSPPEPRRPVAAPQVTRYSLTVTNEPGRKVLATLAASLRVKLVAGPDVAAALDKRVSLREVNAPLEKLLHLVLDPVKLRYELDEQELRVFLGE
jgi:hypothetical protein